MPSPSRWILVPLLLAGCATTAYDVDPVRQQAPTLLVENATGDVQTLHTEMGRLGRVEPMASVCLLLPRAIQNRLSLTVRPLAHTPVVSLPVDFTIAPGWKLTIDHYMPDGAFFPSPDARCRP